jgi:hypothetical protein
MNAIPMRPASPRAVLARPAAALALAAGLIAALPAGRALADAVPPMEHIIVVIMENHSYDQTRVLPYTATLIGQYSSFSDSYGLTHPSQPNYIALFCGSTLGVNSDGCPPAFSPYGYENLGHACEQAGLTWKAYSENLPSPGSTICSTADFLYTRKHDPWVSFANLNHANEVPYTQLATDIAANALPNLAFVVPNNCHNTHDCTVDVGDTWLANNLPAMIDAVGPYGLVILTWDEDEFTPVNHILTVFAGPLVKSNYVSPTHLTHYTVLRTICEALRLQWIAAAADEVSPDDVWNAIPTAVPPYTLAGVRLGAPRPNPSSEAVAATLTLPGERAIRAAIFDASGRRIRALVAGARSGPVELRWDGTRDDGTAAPSGLYWLRVTVGGKTLERKITRLR